MKCPNCGYVPPRGRPKKLNDKVVGELKKTGWSLSKLAKHFCVTKGAIQASLKRVEKK